MQCSVHTGHLDPPATLTSPPPLPTPPDPQGLPSGNTLDNSTFPIRLGFQGGKKSTAKEPPTQVVSTTGDKGEMDDGVDDGGGDGWTSPVQTSIKNQGHHSFKRNNEIKDYLFEEKRENYLAFLEELKLESKGLNDCNRCTKSIIQANNLRKSFDILAEKITYDKSKQSYVYKRRFNRNAEFFILNQCQRRHFLPQKRL